MIFITPTIPITICRWPSVRRCVYHFSDISPNRRGDKLLATIPYTPYGTPHDGFL
jgi:hypothetical protein